jgi:hypothetical protein
MERHLSRDLVSRLKPVAIYQIIGGVIGLGLTLILISDLTEINFLIYPLLFLALALNGHSIFSGILLLTKKTSGLKHSLINQVLQLVSFSILGYTYQYASGIYLITGIDLTEGFSLITNFGLSTWKFIINGDREPLLLNFNLVALGLVIFIGKIKSKAQRESVDKQIDAIGQESQSSAVLNE